MPDTTEKTGEPLHGAAVIAGLRKSLAAKRRQMFDLYQHDVHVGQTTTDDNADDFADRANNSYHRDLMFTLSDNERQMLIHIDDAYRRLEVGSYGRCIHCSQPIGLPRLKALPWARYCIACQERDEMGILDG